MTQPRSKIVDPSVTCWYHCISRCVRRAFLFAENHEFDRKQWLEDNHWLVPIEDRRAQGAKREGIKAGCTLGQYLMLVDCMSRSVREGKASVTHEFQALFDRLEMDAERWLDRLTKLLTNNRLYGSFMATTQAALRSVAQKLGVKQLANTA